MASVSEELRKRVYGTASPNQDQIQAVRKKAYTLVTAPAASTPAKRKKTSSAASGSSGKNTGIIGSILHALRDPSTNGEVVDSTTGQVISVDKPSALSGTVKGAAKQTASAWTGLGRLAASGLSALNDSASSNRRRSVQETENAEHYRQMLTRGTMDDGTVIDEAARKRLEQLAKRAEQSSGIYRDAMEQETKNIDSVGKKLSGLSDRLGESAERDIAQAKEGLGKAGQFAVDLGVAGTQMAGDALLAALTGGSALPFVAARSAGAAAQEAEKSGASFGRQLAYAVGSGALSAATEKLSNVAAPFRKMFGAGVLDQAMEKAAGKLGQTAAGKIALSALGEGGEEIAEDVLQPLLQRITYDKTALSQYQDPEYLANTLYDGLIGAVMGGLGGGVDVAMSRGLSGEDLQSRETWDDPSDYDITPRLDDIPRQGTGTALEGTGIGTNPLGGQEQEPIPTAEQNFQAESPLRAAVSGFLATGTVSNARATAILNDAEAVRQLQTLGIDVTKGTASQRRNAVKDAVAQIAGPIAAPGSAEADGSVESTSQEGLDPRDVDLVSQILNGGETAQEPVRVGRVTTIQHPYQGTTPVQTQKSAAAVTMDSSSVQTAQRLVDGARRLEGAANSRGFKATLKNAYKAIFEPVKNVPVSGVTFDGEPYTVDINSNVPGKVISDPNLTVEKLALLDNLTQVVQNGEYVGSGEYVQHSGKNRPVMRYDYFETPVNINGQPYIAKFDVEVYPFNNNYRTHQIVKIDLTSAEGSLAGPAPAASSETSSPAEGTRPLNSDSTISQGTNAVNEGGPPAGETGTAQGAGPAGDGQTTRGSGALDALGVHVQGDLGEYTGAQLLRGREEGRKRTVKARQEAERRLNPTRGEKTFAKGIAEGDYTAADIPASMHRAVVEELADYYTAENSFKAVDGVKMRGQEIREETEQLARDLLKDDNNARMISMLRMNEMTPERAMRKIFGDELGEAINRTYIYPVQQNEAEKLRFTNRMLDAVRTFRDSTGRESPLTRQERSVVQQMLEDRFVGETVASMEMAESIRNAAEKLKNGKDAADTAKELHLDREDMDLAQRLSRWMQNQELLDSGAMDRVKIENAVTAYARQYDLFYDAINDFLTAHGYSTIGFIKGYAPHMQGEDTQNKLLSALRSMGVNTDAMVLPTSISGLTASYKPGKRRNPYFQSRRGTSTDYDAAAGYESYVGYLADILYHTDDIARLRGLSRYLRKTYGPEEISDAIDHAEGLRNMEAKDQVEVLRDAGRISQGSTLSPQDARAELENYIDSLYDDIKHMDKYSEFVKYIDNYANILAGKQSMADRGMEYTAGRTSLNAGNKLVSAFARAQVAGNLSSALNQSAQLAQLLSEVDVRSLAKATANLAKSTGGRIWNIKATELFDQSDLLTSKKGIEYLTADDSGMDRFVTALFKPADLMDSLISALTVQSKYEQLLSQGVDGSVAMDQANRFATSIMASRAKGSRPLAYESKNLLNQMLHLFQTEAVNSWDHITQDLPRQIKQVREEHGKQAASRAVATLAVKGLLSAFVLNRITEMAYGGTPAPFDILGYITNFVASGRGMSTNGWLKNLVNSGWEKLFGEALFDDDDDGEEEKQPFDSKQAGWDLVYNLLNDVPFVRNAAGILGLGDQTMPLTNIAEAAKGVKEAAGNSGILSGEMGGALLELGATTIPGGRQLQKTGQGIWTILNQGRVYGMGDEARLQYPVERDPFNIVQAVLFGNSGLAESRDFYASGNTGLSAKQTQLVNEMGKSGSDRTAVYNAIQKTRDGEDTAEKAQALARADLSDQEKLEVYAGAIAGQNSSQPEVLRGLMAQGLSWNELAETYPFASSTSGKRYAGYIESGLTPEQAGGLTAEMDALEPEAGKDTVTDLQRYRAVVDYGLSQQDQLTVLGEMMEDSEYESLMSAYQLGVKPEQFVSFREGISGLSADKNAVGKTISGSKKRKVMQFIDSMDLNNVQKTALYYAAGYSASTLDDAPWYGRPESSWNIIPSLNG